MLNKSAILLTFTFFIVVVYVFIQDRNENTTVNEKNIIQLKSNNCGVESKKCIVEFNKLKLKILLDENIYYLKPFKVSVLNENMDELELESIQVDFKMKSMDMGVNRFFFKKNEVENAHIWNAKVLLPICITGRADWISEFIVTTKSSKYLISLPISVKKISN